jgi:hypothetical protein
MLAGITPDASSRELNPGLAGPYPERPTTCARAAWFTRLRDWARYSSAVPQHTSELISTVVLKISGKSCRTSHPATTGMRSSNRARQETHPHCLGIRDEKEYMNEFKSIICELFGKDFFLV